MKDFSNLAKIVVRRTYSRKDNPLTGQLGAPDAHGDRYYPLENWDQIIEREVMGNVKGRNVPEQEIKDLLRFGKERKAIPAGRGLWFSGTSAHSRLGGVALNNCWFATASDWQNFVIIADLLMLGGGVGCSVEHKYVSKLPRIKKDVVITHQSGYGAGFIVPDTREGWCELMYRVFESYFVTGKSFTYSTSCLRGAGQPIKGFGGISSGPLPLIHFVNHVNSILGARSGRHARPIDAADIITAIGEVVVSGNVRRSAILLLGDCWDKEYLTAKRWDLGQIPGHRSNANYSVVCEDADDLHPLFWKTYEAGEAFGIVNRKAIQKYGRMGELKKDTAEGVNPCVPAGTEILTSEGYITIDSVVDQKINVWNGFEWSEVTPKITGHDREIFEVSFNSGQSLKCTSNHEFILAIGYRGKTKKVKLKDLQIGDKLAKFYYPVLEDRSFVEHEEAYTQGFISAEGMDDYSYFYLYGDKKKCRSRLKLRYSRKVDASGRVAVYPSFEKLSKSFVPMSWDTTWKLEWLAGLLDGDGTVLIEGGIQVASVNKKFLLNTQKMLTTLGVSSKVAVARDEEYRDLPDGRGGRKSYFCQELYRLMIGAKEMQFLQELGLRCSRLKISGFKPNRNAGRFITVTNIEPVGVADTVYCFTEPKNHTGCFEGIITGQCGEATLEPMEPCNLQEIILPHIESPEEFIYAARLMHRYGKRVTLEKYHHDEIQEVIDRNRRVGTSITGCLAAPGLFKPDVLDRAFQAIQSENVAYSKELGIPVSIRTTVNKPSGTVSKVCDMDGYEGVHGAWSRYVIQRIRFASNDHLVPILRNAGHYMEPVRRLDGTIDYNTQVVDFYVKAPDGCPVTDEGFGTWEQLKVWETAQKYWADQAVSVSVYYKREEIPQIKEWVHNNIKNIKTISFMAHSEHGYIQAPKEAITKEQYEKMSEKIKAIDFDQIQEGGLESQECADGYCPVK